MTRDIQRVTLRINWRLRAALPFVALLAAACTLPEDRASEMIAPGKFSLYSCDQLAARAKVVGDRAFELKEAMEKSARGPGGELVNSIAYRPEYLTAVGELRDIESEAASKECAKPMRQGSDSIIR